MSRVELLASYWTICGGAEPHTDHEWSPFGLRERAEAASQGRVHGPRNLARRPASSARAPRPRRDAPDPRGQRHPPPRARVPHRLVPAARRAPDRRPTQLRRVVAREPPRRSAPVTSRSATSSTRRSPCRSSSRSSRSSAARRADHGTRIVFELMPFSVIDNLEDALALVQGADQPNGGICIDLWHVVKLGIPYERVAALRSAMSRASRSTTGT